MIKKNYFNRLVWIYPKKINNERNIVFDIFNLEIQREKKKLGTGGYRLREGI